MLCAWSSQYPHRPIPPDQSRSVEVNGTGSVVVPAPAVLQGLSSPVTGLATAYDELTSDLKLISDPHFAVLLRPQQCPRLLQIRFIERIGAT
jgi:hypothetical protein